MSVQPRHVPRFFVATLAAIQFAHIVDFVIMMPLGPQIMRAFGIDVQQFGFLVSSYTFAASASGFVGSVVLDRIERSRAMWFCVGGFTIGTLGCAVSPTYGWLMLSRMVSGAFGGIISAIVFAMIGDAIPQERRGKATGIVMTAFSVASVLGVPAGLWIAEFGGWHSPFLALVGFTLLLIAVGRSQLPRLDGHIRDNVSTVHTVVNDFVAPWREDPKRLYVLLLIAAMMFAGFSIIPYISPYLVEIVGLPESQLPLMYMLGGGATFFTSQIVGRMVDRFGTLAVFRFMAVVSLLPIYGMTHLGVARLPLIFTVSTLFFVFVSGRMVPAITRITGAVETARRGAFMSQVSSLQQLASGLAATTGGLILGLGENYATYPWVGYMGMTATLIAMWAIRNVPEYS